MKELNLEEIQFVEALLRQKGLQKKLLREEWLDHICCELEVRMAEGLTFAQALETIWPVYEPANFRKIERHTLRQRQWGRLQKQLPYGLSTLLGICLLFLVFVGDGIAQNPHFYSPVPSEVNASWGGQWLTAAKGTPIKAAAAGRVWQVGQSDARLGNFIIIAHQKGIYTLYAHLGKVDVQTGQLVRLHTPLGQMGSHRQGMYFKIFLGQEAFEQSGF
ncbi:MAG: hypothetical protein OHK0053_16790 [Microscillaceae bacterium]